MLNTRPNKQFRRNQFKTQFKRFSSVCSFEMFSSKDLTQKIRSKRKKSIESWRNDSIRSFQMTKTDPSEQKRKYSWKVSQNTTQFGLWNLVGNQNFPTHFLRWCWNLTLTTISVHLTGKARHLTSTRWNKRSSNVGQKTWPNPKKIKHMKTSVLILSDVF